MGFNFPATPTVGQVFNNWTWDGEKWQIGGAPNVPEAPTDGFLYGRKSSTWSRVEDGANFTGALSVTPAANALTIVVMHMSGVVPSPANPVFYRVPHPAGGYLIRAITAPLSVTIPAGATLGTISNVPFRIWVAIFDDNGTPRLAVRNNLNWATLGTYLLRYPEHMAATIETPPGNNPASFYGNVAAPNKFWTWVGWFAWEQGLATMGMWNIGPNGICATLLDGMSRPGDMIFMRAHRGLVSPTSNVVTLTDSTLGQTWNSWSAVDPVEVTVQQCYVYLRTGATHGQGQVMIRRGSTALVSSSVYSALTGDLIAGATLSVLDFPGTTASVDYKFSYQNVQALMIQYNASGMICKEYMA
ncbi:hypothetical protein KIP88_02660 [Bradyrhizobium sp. SRL28]|uniref:hypothetical protein n=1 Tax=Bradyrhizobium sp. SRL28 TaxID=2836178 RepID=UPI001BDECD53|nr:hypothetical protein [Bradyrhizobium sp. SRL28]MBT1509392.1 hypothetical protein [Bradyrhizobium sp. SRL28]